MKRQEILQHVLLDISDRCLGANHSVERDLRTIESRYEHEGDSFFTVTLPSMHDSILLSIEHGSWLKSRLWKEHRRGGPVFLREFLSLVFDFHNGGVVLPGHRSAEALRSIRQLLLFFYKEKVLPSPEKVEAALSDFQRTDEQVMSRRFTDLSITRSSSFCKVVDLMIWPYLRMVERSLMTSLPKHGPGATADGSRFGRKYASARAMFSKRQSSVVDFHEFMFANANHFMNNLDYSGYPAPRQEHAMRVAAVPKTQKGPRLIAMEPSNIQFQQQWILSALSNEIARDPLGALCSWMDQSRNQSICMNKCNDIATIDLSEASDRVSIPHAAAILNRVDYLRRAVFSCRSQRYEINGESSPLRKFAPMGSALCFPFESLVFLAIAIEAYCSTDSRAAALLRRSDRIGLISYLTGRLSVYGDDIIVSKDVAPIVVDNLKSHGLVVNTRKSFLNGYFKETCGVDVFDGFCVSIHKARQPFPRRREDIIEFMSWCEVQRKIFHDLPKTSEALASSLKRLGAVDFHPASGYTRWADMTTVVFTRKSVNNFRRHPDYHSPCIQVRLPVYQASSMKLDSEDQLFDWLLKAASRGEETRAVADGELSFYFTNPPKPVRLRKRIISIIAD